MRLDLARQDAELVASGTPALHNVSASGFVVAGLDLEEQQCVNSFCCFCVLLTGSNYTDDVSGSKPRHRGRLLLPKAARLPDCVPT